MWLPFPLFCFGILDKKKLKKFSLSLSLSRHFFLSQINTPREREENNKMVRSLSFSLFLSLCRSFTSRLDLLLLLLLLMTMMIGKERLFFVFFFFFFFFFFSSRVLCAKRRDDDDDDDVDDDDGG